MMMPANYSAINAEVVYGGAVADYLPNAWTAANVKQFNTNIITLVSNTVLDTVLKATLGTMFGGNWGDDGVKLFGDNGTFSSIMKYGFKNYNVANASEMNFFNKVMTGLGVAAAVYTLGNGDAKKGFVKNPLPPPLFG